MVTTQPSYLYLMLVGWWLVFCLVISTGFRSSLVAHLTVQAKFPPIDSLQDLVKQRDWSWAIDQKMMLGAALNFFQSSTDPVVQKVYEKLEILPQEEGLERILQGKFSYLSWKNNVYTAIASYHTDEYGRTQYYIGKTGSPMLTDFGWGFRKGAPFQPRFHQMMNRLIEAGIISVWNDDVMNNGIKSIRKNLRGQANTVSQSTENIANIRL
ncbi:glutamate receptor-like [Palaemon carinicauda]|uniref:glutamate receptor-like n=1 Tax=Palaemon carinicauda TaxID=392227 RepID=UPI0035B58E83